MPLYEYHCEACGESEEKLEGLSASESHDCPKCRAALGMHRQISLTSFALSGSGWFASGYGQGGKVSDKTPEAIPSKPSEGGGGCCGGCACH